MTNASDESEQLPQYIQWVLQDKYGWNRVASHTAVASWLVSRESVDFSAEILADIDQLHQGVPVAYVIGWVNFLECHIDLRYRPLIPRPETEYWVEQFLQKNFKEKNIRVLDLCSGSGCIGVAVVKHLPSAELVAVDIHPDAIQQTQMNLQAVSSEGNWSVIQSDLYSKVIGQFDFILSNPPYVDRAGEYDENTRHEPEQALFAQKNGFGLIEEIILNCKTYLKAGGELWVEFGVEHTKKIIDLCETIGLQAKIHEDQFGKERWAVITRLASRHQN